MSHIPTNCLFSQEQRVLIVQNYVDGATLKELAGRYNCARTTIHRIVDGAGVVRNVQNKKTPSKSVNPSFLIEPVPFPDCRFPGIYKFTNRVNGKIYIGQSRNIHLRYKEHRKSGLNSGQQFTLALKKYGPDSFNFEVLERVDDLTKLNEREQYWMDRHQPYESKKGYNVAVSATNFKLGRKHSAEANKALGIRMKALWATRPHFFTGKKHSVEARQKISEFRKRNPFTEEQKARITAIRVQKMTKRVAQIDLKTSQIIRVWESVTAIQVNLGIPADMIRCACRGFQNNENGRLPKTTHAGYKWEYTSLESAIFNDCWKVGKQVRSKRVAQIDLNTGELVRVWDSSGEAAQELGLCSEAIKNTCRGSYNNQSGRHPKTSHAGYKWKYV